MAEVKKVAKPEGNVISFNDVNKKQSALKSNRQVSKEGEKKNDKKARNDE